MLVFERGNLFSFAKCALVNPVNCEGIMGAGLALKFKERWPDLFHAYRRMCLKGALSPGGVWPWVSADGDVVLCAATKDRWKNPSKKEWISQCLATLHTLGSLIHPRPLAIPSLGCGCGGWLWPEIKPLFEREFHNTQLTLVVLES